MLIKDGYKGSGIMGFLEHLMVKLPIEPKQIEIYT
jgi:hypothetical protein